MCLWRVRVCACVSTAAHRGSISAEHGLGQAKSKYLPLSVSREAIDTMRQVTMDTPG